MVCAWVQVLRSTCYGPLLLLQNKTRTMAIRQREEEMSDAELQSFRRILQRIPLVVIDGTDTVNFEMPCMTCGAFVTGQYCSIFSGRYSFIRPELMKSVPVLVPCPTIDNIVNILNNVQLLVNRLMEQLLVVWWCIKGHDPASPAYVRTATEVKHTLANMANAVDEVLGWLTGGRYTRAVFDTLPDVHNFETWCYTRKLFMHRDTKPESFRTLPDALLCMQRTTNEICEWVPYIHLGMMELRYAHGPDVGNLLSTKTSQPSVVDLQYALGLDGYASPLHIALAHMGHYVGESVQVMKAQEEHGRAVECN
jgi:hypothetical protein